MTVKSTMQYLVLGLALAGVPLLAEADESSTTRLTTPAEAFPDAMESLEEHREWQLLKVEQQGEQTLLHLQAATGQQLAVPTLEGKRLPPGLEVSHYIQIAKEHRGWSFSHEDRLLAFVPNRQGRELLHHQGV